MTRVRVTYRGQMYNQPHITLRGSTNTCIYSANLCQMYEWIYVLCIIKKREEYLNLPLQSLKTICMVNSSMFLFHNSDILDACTALKTSSVVPDKSSVCHCMSA